MKNRVLYILVGCLALAASTQCVHNKPAEPVSGNGMAQWHGRMHSLASSVATLLPLASSQRAFSDPKNSDQITRSLDDLVRDSRSINMSKAKPTNDPAVEFSADQFASNMSQALDQFKGGNHMYARRLIQQSSNFCISCHTRTDQGRANLQFSSLSNLSGLSKLEQMDFFIAVRDYDKALSVFDKVVNSQDAQIENPYSMEVAAQKALAIAVRVKHDPTLANAIVTRIIDAQWAPVYLRLSAMTWKKAIADWQNQPQAAIPPARQLREAKRLLNLGWQMSALNSRGQPGLIYYLRASALLHELLDRTPKSATSAESLYYAGMAAEALRDINLWTLNEYYYESCVRQTPHTQQAKKCYLRLEGNEFVSYSGSDGVYMPDSVRRKLAELKSLAETSDEMKDWNMKGD